MLLNKNLILETMICNDYFYVLLALINSTIAKSLKTFFQTTAFGNALSPDLQPFCFTNADVIVTIDDINDTPPKFNQSAYEFHLVEGLSSGRLANTNLTEAECSNKFNFV